MINYDGQLIGLNYLLHRPSYTFDMQKALADDFRLVVNLPIIAIIYVEKPIDK